MMAILKGHVVAESDDIVESGGYAYFPAAATRREWLENEREERFPLIGSGTS